MAYEDGATPVSLHGAIEEAFASTPHPNQDTINKLRTGDLIGASVETIGTVAFAKMEATSEAIVGNARAALNAYETDTLTPAVVDLTTRHAETGGQLEQVTFATNRAIANAITYTTAQERNADLGMLDKADAWLDLADERAAQGDHELSDTLDLLAVYGWAGTRRVEEHEIGEKIAGADVAIHDAARNAVTTIRDHIEKGIPLPATVIEKLGGTLGQTVNLGVSHLPGGHAGIQLAHDVAHGLSKSVDEAQQYVTAVTDKVVAKVLGTPNFGRPDPNGVTAVLIGLNAGLPRELRLPSGEAWSGYAPSFAQALATRTLLRNPQRIFDPANQNFYHREIAAFASIAAAYDSQEPAETSLLKSYSATLQTGNQ